MAITDGLNEAQKEAVLAKDGPLLIIAGAGSGKTKTVAHRVAHIIQSGTPADKILAVTFTNKAAGEMRERIYALLEREHIRVHTGHEPFIDTFHSLGVYILKNHGRAIGIPRFFTILDEEDTRQIIKDLIVEFELDPDTYTPPRIKNAISSLKQEMIDASTFAQTEDNSPFQRALRNLYAAYEARLQKVKGLDFDDLLMKTVMLLQSSDEVRAFYEERWHYIHIDEYQDTNKAQYILSRLLAGKHRNIAVVGDIDQAIYSWRGADWRNILQFELDWHGAKIITLENNYRSTKAILEAANAVITNNTERREKTLRSTKAEGEQIGLTVLENEKQEGMFIAEYVKALAERGVKPGQIAVLFRTNAQSRAIEEAFLKRNIAYRLIAGVKFYERKEIKDVLGYLKYALNPDDSLSKKRILNTPARGIGKVLTLKHFASDVLSKKEQEKIDIFTAIMEDIKKAVATKNTTDALTAVIGRAGFEAYYKGNKLEVDRQENVKELLSVAKKFDALAPPEGIERLLSEASLATQDTEVEDKDSQVILLTAHAAKGLEFDVVIIAGLEEGLFPHSLSQTPSEIEEERRLFYVAVTRAREKVMITLTRRRMLWGETSFNDPSRFLSEIPEHLIAGIDLAHQVPQDSSYEEESVDIF
ncbi:MAG: UvrD-helicase domain-containing protein [Patescibacteria group bacterium]